MARAPVQPRGGGVGMGVSSSGRAQPNWCRLRRSGPLQLAALRTESARHEGQRTGSARSTDSSRAVGGLDHGVQSCRLLASVLHAASCHTSVKKESIARHPPRHCSSRARKRPRKAHSSLRQARDAGLSPRKAKTSPRRAPKTADAFASVAAARKQKTAARHRCTHAKAQWPHTATPPTR